MGILRGVPHAGVEIGQRAMRAAVLTGSGARRQVGWVSESALPQGLVMNSFTEPNITDMPAFARLLRELVGRSGRRIRKVNVALPDFVSRVSVFDFEMLQGKKDETLQMIKWRLKKQLPMDVEQAALRYQYLGRFRVEDKEQHRYLVSVIKADILEQYERVFREAGFRPAWMETATFAVWNLFEGFIAAHTGPAGRFALVNVSGGKLTVVVFDRGAPRFLRLKDLGGFNGGDEGGGAAVKVLREVNLSLTFYKENYAGSEVGAVFLTGDMDGLPAVRDEIAANSGMESEVLEVGKVLDAHGAAVPGASGLLAFGAALGAASEA